MPRNVVGFGKTATRPTGLGIEGNPCIVELVKKIPGSISYVEPAFARKGHLPVALLRNRAGNFIEPGPGSVSSAAGADLLCESGMPILRFAVPKDLRISTMVCPAIEEVAQTDVSGNRSIKPL